MISNSQPLNKPIAMPGKLQDWGQNSRAAAMFCTRTLLPFMRQKTGYRILPVGSVVVVFAVMLAISAVFNFHIALPFIGNIGASSSSESLRDFAIVFLIAALWQRHNRWKDLQKGSLWHTYSYGVSWFEFLPLRSDFIHRFVDPGVVFLAGLVLLKLDITALGLWLLVSAVGFVVVESHLHDQQVQRTLDGIDLDLDLEAKNQADTHAYYEQQANGAAKARSLQETGGIATGADAELEAQIMARRMRRAS